MSFMRRGDVRNLRGNVNDCFVGRIGTGASWLPGGRYGIRHLLHGLWIGLFFLSGVSCKKSTPSSAPPTSTDSSFFARGADISWLTQMEAKNYSFFDKNGLPQDCLQILKGLGMNAIRLRAWVHPPDGWCGTRDLVVKALRAKNLGFSIMIDFQYSDSWADPGKQPKPMDWTSLNINGLDSALYQYTYHVMDTLKSSGIIPSWVQVGNETNDGMLWEDGRASTHMGQFATLVKSGYQAVKAVCDTSKVIVHISNGFDNSLFRWVFDGLQSAGATWDIIGMSLYPSTTNWQSLDASCLSNMNDMIVRYGKDVMVCETGMDVTAVTESESFLADIIQKTASIPGHHGLGVFYWEPESYNWEGYTKGAFDINGQPTAALNAFLPH